MNYIKRLERDASVLAERVASMDRKIQAFREHLHTDKFRNIEGSDRKDWIATKDVLEWLRLIQEY